MQDGFKITEKQYENLVNFIHEGSYTKAGEKVGKTKQALEQSIKHIAKNNGFKSVYSLLNYVIFNEVVFYDPKYSRQMLKLKLNDIQQILEIGSKIKRDDMTGRETLRRVTIRTGLHRMQAYIQVCKFEAENKRLFLHMEL